MEHHHMTLNKLRKAASHFGRAAFTNIFISNKLQFTLPPAYCRRPKGSFGTNRRFESIRYRKRPSHVPIVRIDTFGTAKDVLLYHLWLPCHSITYFCNKNNLTTRQIRSKEKIFLFFKTVFLFLFIINVFCAYYCGSIFT